MEYELKPSHFFLQQIDELSDEAKKVVEIIQNPRKDEIGILNISLNGGAVKINKEVL